MATLRATGTAGAFRVGYQHAGTVGMWEIVPGSKPGQPFEFHGQIIERHAYWFTQAPLDLVLTLGDIEWVWRDISVIDGEQGNVTVALTERPIVNQRATTIVRRTA